MVAASKSGSGVSYDMGSVGNPPNSMMNFYNNDNLIIRQTKKEDKTNNFYRVSLCSQTVKTFLFTLQLQNTVNDLLDSCDVVEELT